MSNEIAALTIKVDTSDANQAATSLDRLASSAGRTEAATRKTENSATALARSYRDAGTAGQNLERSMGSLIGGFGLLSSAIAALGLATFAREAVNLADAYSNMRGKLGQVTEGADELASTMNALFEVSQRSRTSFEETTNLYASLARSTKDLGTSTADLLTITEAINQTFVISGTSAASAQAALTQLAQGFASGTLRGDELNSVMEQSPRLATAIADSMGVSIGKLRELGQEGKITGAIVADALKDQAAAIEEEFSRMPATVGQSLVQLQNGILLFTGEMDQATGASAKLAGSISGLADILTGAARPALALDIAMRALAITVGVGLTAAMYGAIVPAVLGSAAYRAFALSVALVGPASAIASVGVTAVGVAVRFALGPVGLLITAVGLLATGWSLMDRESRKAEEATNAAAAAAGAGGARYLELRARAEAAAGAQDNVGAGGRVGAAGMVVALSAAEKLTRQMTALGIEAQWAANRLAMAQVAQARSALAFAVENDEGGRISGQKIIDATARLNVETATLTMATRDLNEAMAGSATRSRAAAAATTDNARASRSAASAISEQDQAHRAAIDSAESMIQSLREEAATFGMTEDALKQYAVQQQIAALSVDGLTAAETELKTALEASYAALLARQRLLTEVLDEPKQQTITETAYRLPNNLIGPLDQMADKMREIDEIAQGLGQSLSRTFGRSGQAIGDIVTTMTGYRTEIAELFAKAGNSEEARAKATKKAALLEVQAFGDMAGSAKEFFDEKSAGYKILQGVEMGFRAFELASSAAAIAQGWMETSQSVAQAGVKGAADTAAGGAKIFSQLGMWAFPIVGAMLAVLGGLGGSGGSVSAPTLPTTNTGTGTVLGNSGDQSQSIGNSVDLAERYWNRDLDFSNKQLASLKAIQANIGSLTTAIAKEMNVGGGLDPTGLNRGPATSGGFLGLFQNTTSSSVTGSGINLNSGNLADLIAEGVSGGLYQLVQTTRTNSGFLGIGGSTRTTSREVTTGIDSGLSQEFSRVLASLRDGVLTAAGQLGITGAEAVLAAFQVNLGRISFEGMSTAEISEALSAVFSAAGDEMAAAILPGLSAFQQAGEGMFETLSRLATEYRAVDQTLASIGMTFAAVGLASIEARTRLVDLSGGLDAFVEGADFFAQNFLSDAQRIAPVQAAVTAELARLGVAANISRTGFADLVLGLDVSTAAGAAMFASLMNLAPALDRVLTYQDELTGVVTEVADAIDLSRQRRSMEIALMEAQGQTSEALAARRAVELAAMDATLRPLQQQIYAALDLAEAARAATAAQAEAARAAEALATRRQGLEIQLMEASGNAAGALAARRALEVAALDATLRPLQLSIYAAMDLAAANEVLARAQANAAAAAVEAARAAEALAGQRRGLEIELMDATGNAAGALAARRELELAALDASLRPLQLAIFAALDLASAAETLANAQAEATAQAEAEVERVAQIAATRRDLEVQLMEAQGDAIGALAARRALEIAALDETLRPLQGMIYAAQDAATAAARLAEEQAAAAQAAEELANAERALAGQRRSLDIQLLEATGQAAAALAATRQDELAALDASLRPIQSAIYAALDLASANEAAAQAQRDAAQAAEEVARTAAALASQRRSLEIELMDATGNSAGAVAARREDEISAMDETLRALQRQIYAARDLASATDAAAAAQEASAASARAVAGQQRNLDIQLMEAQGRTAAAIAARRADELAGLDPSLRGTQGQIYDTLDRAAETARVATEAERAAAAAQQIANQRRRLEIELMRESGNVAGAVAATRADEVAALDVSLRAVQQAIYAAQDRAVAEAAAAAAATQAAAEYERAQEAALRASQQAAQAFAQMQEDAMDRVNDARSNLTQAYEREAGALRNTIETFRGFGASIREFRDSLGGSGASSSYRALRAEFEQTAALAQLGNQDALGSITGAGQAFLDAAMNSATSSAAYNRDVGQVRAALDAAAGTADRTASLAEQQLAQLDASVSGLITLNESVLSVRDGILALQLAIAYARGLGVTEFAAGGVFTSPTMFKMGGSLGRMAEAGPEAIMPLVSGPNGLGVRSSGGNGNGELVSEIRALRQEVAQLRTSGDRAAAASEKTAKTLVQVTRGGESMLTAAA